MKTGAVKLGNLLFEGGFLPGSKERTSLLKTLGEVISEEFLGSVFGKAYTLDKIYVFDHDPSDIRRSLVVLFENSERTELTISVDQFANNHNGDPDGPLKMRMSAHWFKEETLQRNPVVICKTRKQIPYENYEDYNVFVGTRNAVAELLRDFSHQLEQSGNPQVLPFSKDGPSYQV